MAEGYPETPFAVEAVGQLMQARDAAEVRGDGDLADIITSDIANVIATAVEGFPRLRTEEN